MNKISSYLIRKKSNLFFFSEKNGILLGLVTEKVMPSCPFLTFLKLLNSHVELRARVCLFLLYLGW